MKNLFKPLFYLVMTILIVIYCTIMYIILFPFFCIWYFKIFKYSNMFEDDPISLSFGKIAYIDYNPIDTWKRWWWFFYELDAQWNEKENKVKLPKNIKKL